jgi:DNA-binding response OmpR family regulator
MMPKVDGFELAEGVRAFDKTTPIIFMSAKDDKPSKMYGYKLGIDDYITKPFDIDELVMKVVAILRRAKIESEKEITIGNFKINADERTAVCNGEEIPPNCA